MCVYIGRKSWEKEPQMKVQVAIRKGAAGDVSFILPYLCFLLQLTQITLRLEKCTEVPGGLVEMQVLVGRSGVGREPAFLMSSWERPL